MEPSGKPPASARTSAAVPPASRMERGSCRPPGKRCGGRLGRRSTRTSPASCCGKAARPSCTSAASMRGCMLGQNHDGPRSKPSSAGRPAASAVRIRPPSRSRASKMRKPMPASCSSRAACRPARPPPMMATGRTCVLALSISAPAARCARGRYLAAHVRILITYPGIRHQVVGEAITAHGLIIVNCLSLMFCPGFQGLGISEVRSASSWPHRTSDRATNSGAGLSGLLVTLHRFDLMRWWHGPSRPRWSIWRRERCRLRR